jgi:hypothetical protein
MTDNYLKKQQSDAVAPPGNDKLRKRVSAFIDFKMAEALDQDWTWKFGPVQYGDGGVYPSPFPFKRVYSLKKDVLSTICDKIVGEFMLNVPLSWSVLSRKVNEELLDRQVSEFGCGTSWIRSKMDGDYVCVDIHDTRITPYQYIIQKRAGAPFTRPHFLRSHCGGEFFDVGKWNELELRPSFLHQLDNVVLLGFFRYFAFSDILPLIYYFKCGDRNHFSIYYEDLCAHARSWRGPLKSAVFWRFLMANQSFVKEALEMPGVSALSAANFFHYVDSSSQLKVLSVEGPLMYAAGAMFALGNTVAERFSNFQFTRRFKNATYDVGNPRAFAWMSSDKQDAKRAVASGIFGIVRNLIWLEAGLHFMKAKDYARAFAQLLAATTAPASNIVAVAGKFFHGAFDWSDINRAWENGFDMGQLEVETVEGPEDMSIIWTSELWRKFAALTTSVVVHDFYKLFPSSWHGFFTELMKFMASATAFSQVTESFTSFVLALVKRCYQFSEDFDWRVFLSDGGFDTWPERGQALIKEASTMSEKYPTILDFVSDVEKFIDEGDKYRRADLKRALNARKFTPQHEYVYSAVLTRLLRAKKKIEATTSRKKPPHSEILIGPPGVGKTSMMKQMVHFDAKHVRGRALDEFGNPMITGADMYSVSPQMKHWTNCTTPNVLVFNDIMGDGYSNNGQTMNLAEMLRLAIDVEPFFTPQADIQDKFDCVIDPGLVFCTTNHMKWIFSCWGTDWKKLVRRYPNVHYVAYPASCYLSDITPCGSDHGMLIDPEQEYEPWMEDQLRIYECKMSESGGVINFTRTRFLGYGKDVLVTGIKTRYLQWNRKEGYAYSAPQERCCMDTKMEWHISRGKCMTGCDYGDAVVDDVQCFPVEQVVDDATDRLVERFVQRRENWLRAKFQMACDLMCKFRVELGLVLGAFSGGVLLCKLYSQKNVEEVEAVINPLAQKFTPTFVDRYGCEDLKAVEIPNPPKYPNTQRAYATMSPFSKTSSFKDVCALAFSQEVKFSAKAGVFGHGVFISSEYLLLNTHTARAFQGQLLTIDREGNDFNYVFRLDDIHCERDFCVARVPTFPARDIMSHLADSVGSQMRVLFKKEMTTANAMVVNFGGLKGIWSERILNYSVTTVSGDCGRIAVADVDGKGVIVSMHVAHMSDNTGGGLVIDRKLVLRLVEKHFVAPTSLIANKFVDSIQGLFEKSKFRSAEKVSMRVIGTFERANKLAKSRLRETEMNELAQSQMTEKYVIPRLHVDGEMVDGVWKAPYVHKFLGMSYPVSNWKKSEILQAMDDYLKGFRPRKLSPMSLAQAVNGVEGDSLLKSMNLKTSMGVFQRFYPDKSFVVDRNSISAEMLGLLEEYVTLLETNVIAEHQKWSLKDELVSEKKEKIKKYRYFMVNDFLNLFAFRSFVAPLVAELYRNKEFCEAYGAFNPASPEFGEMFLRLKAKGLLVMADIKHMDSSHRSFLIDMVGELFWRMAKMCGYCESAASVVRNLIRSIVFSLVELNGDLAFVTEGMGSGVYVTFIVNCVVLCLLYRIAWFRLENGDFRASNALVVGGDDSCLGTNSVAMNGIHIMEVFSEYGYELSPPTDKSGDMREFFDWGDFVFLKRSPSEVPYGGKIVLVGALAKDSIWKSIGWEMPSPDVTHLDRMSQVLDAGQREMALHGEEAFDDFLLKVKPFGIKFRSLSHVEVLERYVCGKFYDELLESWYVSPPCGSLVSLAEDNQTAQRCDHHEVNGVLHNMKAVFAVEGPLATNPGGKNVQVKILSRSNKNNIPTENSNTQKTGVFVGSDQDNTILQQTTVFSLASDVVSGGRPLHSKPDFGAIKEQLDLPATISRPTYLGSLTWTPIMATTDSLDLYRSWASDAFILSKLRGFKFFRGRPKLRLVVNGLSFYYGKLVACLELNPGSDTLEGAMDPLVNSINVRNVAQALMSPHISIDPSQSTTYELEFPFYSTTGWFDRFDLTKSPAVFIRFMVVNALASANDVAPSSVNIKYYLIMDDVELSVPAIGALEGPDVLYLEGPKEDEPEGTISKPLMQVSRVAAMLGSVPFIGELATPVSMIAGGLSSVAAWLGYSRPVILEESRPCLNLTYDQPSYMEGRAAVTKLTADPKQAVSFTAEAATVGSDDDMLIANIVRRFGLMRTVLWTPTGIIDNNVIPVGPAESSDYSTLGWDQLAPVGWVASRFHYWSGSLVYKFEIVASGFHRGTLGVTWVPYNDNPAAVPLEYVNQFITKIVDITETKEFEFVVPFASHYPNIDVAQRNGTLRVYEINPLRAPGSTSNVSINVYVAAGKDFELYRPMHRPEYAGGTYIFPNAVQGPADIVGETGSSVTVSEVAQPVTSGREKIYFGESFTSIKQLCNRHSLAFSGTVLNSANSNATFFEFQQYPVLPYELDSRDYGSTVISASYAAWFAPGFLAMRGGFRFKYVPRAPRFVNTPWTASSVGAAVPAQMNVQAFTTQTSAGAYFTATDVPTLALGNALDEFMQQTGSGTALETTWIHGGLEFEVPYILPVRFINPRKIAPRYHGSTGEYVCVTHDKYASDASVPFDLWTSVADDFSLHYFMFVPEYRLANQNPA